MAVVSTVVLAVLPINIAYSRFGWDSSQSLLFTLPVVHLSLLAIRGPQGRRWLAGAAAALAAATLVTAVLFSLLLIANLGGAGFL